MHSSPNAAQRGLSLISLLFVAVIVAAAALLVVRVVPTVIEYRTILKAVKTVSTESTPAAARSAFDRAASVDYFDAISGKDLEIVKRSGNGVLGTNDLVVSFAYRKEIHLFGPASLALDYAGSSR